MQPEDVTFRVVDAEIEDLKSGDQRRTMEVIEIKKPDGNISVFPADAVNAESGKRYQDLYARKYAAFKRGEIDPDRADQLNREIAERQAELKAPGNQVMPTGEQRQRGDDGGHQFADKDSARSAADHDQSTSKPDFANMSEAKLRLWITNNGGEEQRANASQASLVSTAEDLYAKAERKKARAETAANK